MPKPDIRIGGACGYWGESPMATPQFLASDSVDYIVYDYLAEITMSIMARSKAKDASAGYAKDFISSVLQPNLTKISQSGVRLVSNAGGLNPEACGAAARALIKELGLDLKVAVITGDNLTADAATIAAQNHTEMFSGDAFPPPETIASINAYLGAFPIAKALGAGADIVITGRCVDSALTLGICIHEFGWEAENYDLLASGSLAGHIIECGPQATGGNFTDWKSVGDIAEIGYPIATVSSNGSFTISKPEGTSGLVSIGTVSEQMLYEIGDPQSYMLPDVVCDFSEVAITQEAPGQVRVSPAKGYSAPDAYKTCATFIDGFRTGTTVVFYGFDAAERAQAYADAAFARARKTLRLMNAAEYTETSVEIIGADSQYGASAPSNGAREITLKIAAKHPTPVEGGVLLKELVGLGLAAPSGLSGFQGARAKPSPVVRLYSYLTPKSDVVINIDNDGENIPFAEESNEAFDPRSIKRPAAPTAPPMTDDMISVPLIKLAWARSGDKGNKANVGVIARRAEYLPYIWHALTTKAVAECFAHFIEGDADERKTHRFLLPGTHAINFLIDDVLGGGGIASIRSDPQGKGYGQILLARPIPIPASLAKEVS